jgi:hypothetical protein
VRKKRPTLERRLGEVEMQFEAHTHGGDVWRAGGFAREDGRRTKGEKDTRSHGVPAKLGVEHERGAAVPWREGS